MGVILPKSTQDTAAQLTLGAGGCNIPRGAKSALLWPYCTLSRGEDGGLPSDHRQRSRPHQGENGQV